MAKPKPIHSILEDTLKSLGVNAPMKGYSIWGAWREIVGESVASNAQPSAIRNRILFIEVSHPTWIQQLQFLKPTLLEKVNAFLGQPLVQDIRFRLGKINPVSTPFTKAPVWIEEELDRKTMRQIEALLQKIEDGEVRRNLKEVIVKGAKVEQYRKKSK